MEGPFSHPGRQFGAALITSLLMLLVMTLIGMAAMKVTNLEEKMAGNLRDRNLAFQAAETALRAGENWVLSRPDGGLPDCLVWIYYQQDHFDCDGVADISSSLLDLDFWHDFGIKTYDTDGGTHLASVPISPGYVVEKMPVDCPPLDAGEKVPDECYFRVTARGTGGTSSAEVILQSVYMYKR